MRIFIGVDLSKEVKDYLFELQKELRELPGKIKWTPKYQLHLTMKFLGEVSEDKLKDIKEKLKNIKLKKFKVKLSSIGVFPTKDYIRIIWVGLSPEEKILDLYKKIDSELMEFKDSFEFKAHLTFGRVKFVKDKKRFMEIINKIEIKPLEFEIQQFELVESVLNKDGPQYTVLESYILD
jgi:2'-5' RNA ligase